MRQLPGFVGLEKIPGIDGDVVIAEAAFASAVATQTADEWFGGLSTGISGSLSGNCKAAWTLSQVLNLMLFGGSAVVRPAVKSTQNPAEAGKGTGGSEPASEAASTKTTVRLVVCSSLCD